MISVREGLEKDYKAQLMIQYKFLVNIAPSVPLLEVRTLTYMCMRRRQVEAEHNEARVAFQVLRRNLAEKR